jgi:methionyl-tRNA formyltransferase
MHDSLLPRFRGFAPTITALIGGESKLGVTALLATDDMDSRPILVQQSVVVDQFVTIERAFEALGGCYIHCLRGVLEMGADLKSLAKNQDSSKASYSVWRDEGDFWIEWSSSADEIVRFVNAVGYPYKGARTSINNREVVVSRAALVDELFFENRHPGKLWKLHDSYSADVICGSGLVRVWANWGDGDSAGVFSKLRTRLGRQVTP